MCFLHGTADIYGCSGAASFGSGSDTGDRFAACNILFPGTKAGNEKT